MVVRGEGVFFEFSEKRLKEWVTKKEVIARAKFLSEQPQQTTGSERTKAKRNKTGVCFDSHLCSFGD